MTGIQNLRINYLLDALPGDVYERLFRHLEQVQMTFGEVLYEPGEKSRYAYFPTSCTVSLFHDMENGASSEIAVVGNEGMVNIDLFMGGGTMPNRAIVLTTGYVYRLSRQLFLQEFYRYGALNHLLLRYTQVLITQMAQTTVCNRHHSVEQQLCRRLLQSLDRLSSNELTMAQALIAKLLGVRREVVTEAAETLQRAGLIEYGRGRITVLDRLGLKARACECYQIAKTVSDRLFISSRRGLLTSRPEVSLYPLHTLQH
ncbi:Crp/Fnr family transcriptional regulator [Methylomicrobium sp. Wu6]|uniref:Crp/Fnr family transcriptional regulator n=1 Tax=Methylomicrobium sp. Wu6 TaxID=3107928 RepID=UPI002DD64E09|nr:Crp/Fnr family transcriptional regulator [Methylomicrobium sp. Wu6]MEC4747345.1 Crp/Fnr family transcriptional regulator [Methylomicrobium sp. Wu6]